MGLNVRQIIYEAILINGHELNNLNVFNQRSKQTSNNNRPSLRNLIEQ